MPKRKRSTGVRRPFQYTTSRGETRWKASIDVGVDAEGKRIQKRVTAKTFAACNRKLKDIEGEIRDYGTPLDHNVKFGKVAADWLEAVESRVDPNTLSDYRSKLSIYAKNLNGTPVTQITSGMIQKCLDAAKRDGAGISVRRRLRVALNQVMKTAVADRIIAYNPVTAVPNPTSKDLSTVKGNAFSVPELKALLTTAQGMPPELGTRYIWKLLSGQRQGEILGAVEEELHLEPGVVPHYRVMWQTSRVPRKHGCGQPLDGSWPCGHRMAAKCPKAEWRVPDGFDMRPLQGCVCLTRPKSSSIHLVPLLPELREALMRYRKATEDWPNPHGLIFRHRDGTIIGSKEDAKGFNDLMTLAGIDPEEHRGHDTRNALVTVLRKQRVDPRVVELIVGHSSRAVDDRYFNVDLHTLGQAMDVFAGAIGSPPPQIPNRGTTTP